MERRWSLRESFLSCVDEARNHLTQLPVNEPQLWCSSWRESEDGLATAVVTATAVVRRRDEVAACVGWFRELLQRHVKPWDLRHPGWIEVAVRGGFLVSFTADFIIEED